MKKLYLFALGLMMIGLSASMHVKAQEIAQWSGFKKAAVSFTFHQGAPCHTTTVAPMFDKYGYKASFYLVTGYNPDWTSFQTLANNGHEIGSESETYGSPIRDSEITGSKTTINSHITGQDCNTLSYPNCQVPGNKTLVGQNYIAALSCGKTGIVEGTPDDWYEVPINMTGSEGLYHSGSQFQTAINNAISKKGWVLFMTHGLLNKENGYATYSPTDQSALEGTLKWISEGDIQAWVTTVRNAAMYAKERDASTFAEVSRTSTSITYSLTHSIADAICNYDFPLSLRVPLQGWTNIEVKQDGNVIPHTEQDGYIYFDAVPNGGNIVISHAAVAVKKVYTVFTQDDGVLTFYYDDKMGSRSGKYKEVYNPLETETLENRFKAYNTKVTKAVIDESMKNYPYTSMLQLFQGGDPIRGPWISLVNMTSIEGLENLNTSNVTDMEAMFADCEKLTTLDVSGFDVSNVTNMNGMFTGCENLTTLDLTGFDVSKVTGMYYMFADCKSLKTIYCNDDWSTSSVLKVSTDMFLNCYYLKGGNGTAYSSSIVGKTYARPDKDGQPGYFTVKLTPEEQKQVDVVVDLINAIFASGDITLESEPAIVAAREAYNALSEAQQAAVYNYDSLVEAEATLAAIKANIPIITDGWVHYDNGVFYNSFKIGETETWGIRIPANTVEEKALTEVSMYAYSAGEYTLEVYNGGATPAEGKQLSSQVVNMPTAGDFNIATLANPVPVDPTQDIWVIFKNTAGLKGPMSACAKAGSSNGSWYFDGEGWFTADSYGIAWMIRAFFETFTGEAWIDGINYFLDGSDLTAQVLDLSGDKYVGDIVVPEKATYINDYTVTSINSEAFTNSPELLSVSLPKTVNWIEPGSFLRNPKLTAINVAPANTTYSSLDGVLFNTVQTELIAYPTGRAGAYVVPEGVESILDEAFTDNANLTAITLPASLIEIASLAFEECTGLTAITSKAVNAPAAGSDAFQKVSKSIPVYVPEKGLASYKAEYEWKDFTNFIAIEDKAAADAVIVKIEAIGAVTYTTECKDRIDAARNAYDALTAEQKALVPAEKLAILTAAEKAYADLKAQAEADQAAADIVIGQINAIGTVTLSSEPAIVAARQAYDALTDAQKALVSNYAVLTAAEVKLEILKKQAESDAAAAKAVTDLINGIGTVTYTTDCKERIDAAREAYNALTDAQKALVTNLGTLTAAEKAYADLKAQAEADQAAADIVIGKINAIGVVSYSEASKALIDDARAAYDALTDAQKGLIPAATYKVLTDAEQAYADLKAKAAADLAAANIVITKIDAIGSVTLASEPAIVDARAAYNALTTDQKALVTNYATLVAAEKALADLKAKAAADQAAADNVIAEINAIGTVTLSSEPAIVAARAAYNALTADQKALVTNLSTLTAAEAKLDQLKKQAAADQAAADLVIGKINAIGTVSYSEASKALIDAARTAYDALTAAQQALVTNLATLTAAEKAYADLKAKAEADQAAANTVIAQIDAIGEVTLASEPAIVAARAAYNALTADQKALVSNYNVLTAAEAKLEVLKKQAESDEAAAAAVSNLISGIGTVTYTTECKARIDAAREAYDALTDVQKALVTNLATLTAAEKAYADLKAKAEADQAAATAVIGKINAIGEVTLASEPAIIAARSAYNALTADQKALVSNYSVLTAAEAKLEVLKQQAEADQAAATAVSNLISGIGTVAYDEASKARIDDARHAYDALTAAQKALVTNYGVLTAAEQAYADLKAQAEVIAAAKQQLVDLVSEATALKAVAAMYAPAAVGEIEAIIASAQATINDPNATLEEINMKYDNLQYDFELEANKLLEEAKEQLKQSIRALYQPGDYPSWYASAIIPALDQVDAITWDFSMTVQENILLFQATGQTLYNNAKKALEDLRAKDTRELVSSCTFTGFADAIQLDMTWNIKALNELINTLNASVAAEPYRLDAEMSSLGKWDPVNKELIILDPYEAQKLTAGDYQFITAVKIDGEDAKQYRLPKATEEVLSVTVDAAVWAVDLSGIVIDATYSYTYVTSPMFTISKSEDVELVNEDLIKTQKIYHNGHFYILRGEHIYTIQGTLVR